MIAVNCRVATARATLPVKIVLAARSEAPRTSAAATWCSTSGSPAMRARPGLPGIATVPPSTSQARGQAQARGAVRARRDRVARAEARHQHAS